MTTKKSTPKKAAKPSAKKTSKPKEKIEDTEIVTEYDYNTVIDFQYSEKQMRTYYWSMAIIYFKKWGNTFFK